MSGGCTASLLGTLLRGVALSLPTVVSAAGAVEVIEPAMDEGERAALQASAEVLRRAMDSLAG